MAARIVLGGIRRGVPTIVKEMVREAAEDQFKEKVMGIKRNLYTDLPTRGGALYTFIKAALSSTPAEAKLQLAGELQSEGISPQGATELTSGENPKLQADLANLMRLVSPNGADRISISAASPTGVEVPAGEVYTAAMVSMPTAEE